MKLTKEALKQLIKEELKGMGGGKDILSALRAAAEQNPGMSLKDYLETLEKQKGK